MKPPEKCNELEEVRREIDILDREIVRLIGRRAAYARKATDFKTDKNSVHAPERQRAMLAQRREWASEEGLDPDIIEELYVGLIQHFVAQQMASLKLEPKED